MKIREGFVTNSSSSNFILGFKTEDMEKELLCDRCGDFIKTILYDCRTASLMTVEDVLSLAMDEFTANAAVDYRDEGYESEDAYIDGNMADITSKIEKNDYQVFVEVNYGNETPETETIEAYIAPNLKCCIASFNYH